MLSEKRINSLQANIWCLFGDKPFLNPLSGDSIGESRIVKMLSKVFNVFYNGVFVASDDIEFGGGQQVEIPKGGYDYYYVRNNPELFLQLPHPKLYMAYPYHELAFRVADALVVTTDIWKSIILDKKFRYSEKEFFNYWYPKDAYFPQKTVQFKQACDPLFKGSLSNTEKVDRYRLMMTNYQSMGFFGRLDSNSLPYGVIRALDSDSALQPVLVFVGKIRAHYKGEEVIPKGSLYLGEVEYTEMPSLYEAVDCTLAGEGYDDRVLGSNKILDSISLSTPVICKRNMVREEYLGSNYPGLFSTIDEAKTIINSFFNDGLFREKLINMTIACASTNSIENAALKTKESIESVFG